MLEKPDLQDEAIVACLQADYGLNVRQIEFLPLGADPNTAVYRAVAIDGTSYFVKLRSGNFEELAVRLPKFLSDQGIRQIIPPLPTKTGQLWASLNAFKLILYPFIHGRDAYEVKLSASHWHAFGAALRRLHTTVLPPDLTCLLQPEMFSPRWREFVKAFLERVEVDTFTDPIAGELAAFLKTKRIEILDLVQRTERYAQTLLTQSSDLVVCHTDVHAGNILIDAHDALYIVDWDNPSLTPKERDLMFIGGGQGFTGHSAQTEIDLFYQGYGPTQIDPAALAYYRFERIIQDIAVFCEQLLLTTEGGADRAQSLRFLKSNFLPNGTIALAYQAEKMQR